MQEIYVILRMGAKYLILGLIAMVAFAVAYAIGYLLIYKKVIGGSKRVKFLSVLKWGILIFYIMLIVWVTLIQRRGYFGRLAQLQLIPFYSYIEAWNYYSFTLWRNIILNIVLFIPLGFLFPWITNNLKYFYRTYGVAFLFTLGIESIQLAAGLGVFDVDDIIGNTTGAMIGYGLFMICYSIWGKGFKPIKWKQLVLLQIPLICTIAVFTSIFTIYNVKELGNLKCDYIYKAPSGSFDVSLNDTVKLDEKVSSEPVYINVIYSHNEVIEIANKLLYNINDKVDEKQTKFYENTAYLHSKGNCIITISYVGGGVSYTDFENNADFNDEISGNTKATKEELVSVLSQMGIDIPTQAEFNNLGDGWYEFSIGKYVDGDYMFNGVLSLRYTDENIIDEYTNDIQKTQIYKDFDIISQAEAYEHIRQGRFYRVPNSEKDNIVVNGVRLEYDTDTKGFYQPIYCFDATINGEEGTIKIPAIKK